jgi:hypothetical protein
MLCSMACTRCTCPTFDWSVEHATPSSLTHLPTHPPTIPGAPRADLKSDNILLKSEPPNPVGVVAKLTDFGLSTVLSPEQTHVSQYKAGTPHYMDPAVSG